MKQSIFTIVSNEALTDVVYKMVLEGDTSAITNCGQFVDLRLPEKYLRRPISVCDWDDAVKNGVVAECAQVLRDRGAKAVMVAGCAQREFLGTLVGRSGIEDVFEPLYVKNSFFGGNVDVTGLLVGQEIACAVREHSENAMQVKPAFYLVPRVVFNDDALTLDDMTLEDMGKASGARLSMVSCSPKDYFKEITKLARQM